MFCKRTDVYFNIEEFIEDIAQEGAGLNRK